jgi:hypothetical protein
MFSHEQLALPLTAEVWMCSVTNSNVSVLMVCNCRSDEAISSLSNHSNYLKKKKKMNVMTIWTKDNTITTSN